MKRVLVVILLLTSTSLIGLAGLAATVDVDHRELASDESDSTSTMSLLPSGSDPIDGALKHVLQRSSAESNIEVIIQFDDGGAGEQEWRWLRDSGLTPLHSTTVVPAVLASGPAHVIADLAGQQGIRWVEWNSPLEYQMNLTVDTIGARKVWDRELLTASRQTESDHPRITGAGVTVVVLDSGIDATHPDLDYNPQSPNNPQTPAAGDKVIYNAKLDQGTGNGGTPEFVWVPMQNTDTTSGHGTHCAGTVAGNGDASAGDKRGVAPDAWLIGLSMGETVMTIDEYSGLEYVYTLSEPGSSTQEAWNIRVVSNSWGPGFPFDSADSNDLTVQMIDKLSWDNNVAVIFANGNDGGDGGDDESNIFAKVPSAIGVAAANRNGVGMSSFSSRGDASDITTWPDVAAPGVDIWSAAARATMIGGGTGIGDTGSGELDYYYLAISGTSMATPHVAGLAALMFQAAPSLHMSSVDEDLSEAGDPSLHDPTGSAPPATASRQIHELELILKLTTNRIETGENLASSSEVGLMEREFDFAQGYGLIDADRAVATALALQQARDPDGDGIVDNPDVEVWDVVNRTEPMLLDDPVIRDGDQLSTEWDGEFAVFSSGTDFPPASSHRRELWIPAGTTRVLADMEYQPLPTSILCPTSANLRLALDKDGDGNYEENDVNGQELVFIGGTEEGQWWSFDVQGNAAGTCLTPNPSTVGPRSPYSIDLAVSLQPGDYHLDINQSRGWTVGGQGSAITLDRSWYLHLEATALDEGEQTGVGGMFEWMQTHWYVPTLIAFFFLFLLIGMNEGTRSMISQWRSKTSDDEVLEAVVIEAEVIEAAPAIAEVTLPPPAAKPNIADQQPTVESEMILEPATEEVTEPEEMLEAEEVTEPEVVVEAEEVAEAEQVLDSGFLEAEVVEAVVDPEIVEAAIIEEGESDEEDNRDVDEDDELDAFLDDFDE